MPGLQWDLGMSLHPSVPQFPHLLNGRKSTAVAGVRERPAGPASSTVHLEGQRAVFCLPVERTPSAWKPCLVSPLIPVLSTPTTPQPPASSQELQID